MDADIDLIFWISVHNPQSVPHISTVNGKKVFGSSGQLRKKFRLGFLIYLYNIPDNKQFDAALSWTALN